MLHELQTRAWLPTAAGTVVAPQDAFLPTPELRGALGSEVAVLPLVDPSMPLGAQLAKLLGVCCSFDVADALRLLRRAAAQPAAAAETADSLALQRCYRVLGARCAMGGADAQTVQAALRVEKLLRVESGWATACDCVWEDVTGVLRLHSLERVYGAVTGLNATLFASLGVPARAPVLAFLERWRERSATLSDSAMLLIYRRVNEAAAAGTLDDAAKYGTLKMALAASALRTVGVSTAVPPPAVVINDDEALSELLRKHGVELRFAWVPPGEHWTQYRPLLRHFLGLRRLTTMVDIQVVPVLLQPRAGAAAIASGAPFFTEDIKRTMCGLLYNKHRAAWAATRESGTLATVLAIEDVLCQSLSLRYTMDDGRTFELPDRAAWCGSELWRVAELSAAEAAAARDSVLLKVAGALVPNDAGLAEALHQLASRAVMAAQHEPGTAAALFAQHAPSWDASSDGADAAAFLAANLKPNRVALIVPPRVDEADADEEEEEEDEMVDADGIKDRKEEAAAPADEDEEDEEEEVLSQSAGGAAGAQPASADENDSAAAAAAAAAGAADSDDDHSVEVQQRVKPAMQPVCAGGASGAAAPAAPGAAVTAQALVPHVAVGAAGPAAAPGPAPAAAVHGQHHHHGGGGRGGGGGGKAKPHPPAAPAHAAGAGAAATRGVVAGSGGGGGGGGANNATPHPPAGNAQALNAGTGAAAVQGSGGGAAPMDAAAIAAAVAAATAAAHAAAAAAAQQSAADDAALLKSLLASQRCCAVTGVDVPAALTAVRLPADGAAAGGSNAMPPALLLRADLAGLFRAQQLVLKPIDGMGLAVRVMGDASSAGAGAQAYRALGNTIAQVDAALLDDEPLCEALQRSFKAASQATAGGAGGVKREAHDGGQAAGAGQHAKRPKLEDAGAGDDDEPIIIID
jgi:hypothetical protein